MLDPLRDTHQDQDQDQDQGSNLVLLEQIALGSCKVQRSRYQPLTRSLAFVVALAALIIVVAVAVLDPCTKPVPFLVF